MSFFIMGSVFSRCCMLAAKVPACPQAMGVLIILVES
jgi:hypothetical protein